MTVGEAQREVRSVYLGGSVGQAVSGAIWLIAAALGTWGSTRQAILCLVVGGMFIFPITQLVLRSMGRPASLSPGNPLRHLAMEVAFLVPLLLPVAGGAALHKLNWFFPACMMIVGAHYLPFHFLYGMWQYLALGAVLLAAGLGLGLMLPTSFTAGAWLTGAVLLLFAAVARRRATR